ncbi:MAG TPA: DUF1566 domain-containing protein, partial [Magnetococcales bacterium]|nr:DUF1566 domain-containing protein [Magnetococcales bacterium]
GTVKDTQTGLVWMKNGSCWGGMAWEAAGKAVADLTSGKQTCEGYTGKGAPWRLPTKDELKTLMGDKKGTDNLTLPEGHPFSHVKQGHYWSASEAETAGTAWYVNTSNGHVDVYGKQEAYFVWPVREDKKPTP